MKRYTINLLNNQRGPKQFFSNKERLILDYSPLNQFEEYKKQIENDFKIEGIYLLLGQDDEGNNSIYIGETDNIDRRIYHHTKDENKNFADTIITISSYTRERISKDELHYIERKLINLFNASDYKVENGNSGQGKELSPFDKLQIADDLEFILLALESFGVKLENTELISNSRSTTSINRERTDIEIYCDTYKGEYRILGILHPDNSVTIKGSQEFEIPMSRKTKGDRHNLSYAVKYAKNSETIDFVGDIETYKVIYIKDSWYKSPSGSSILIRSGTSNGWMNWKVSETNLPIDIFRKK